MTLQEVEKMRNEVNCISYDDSLPIDTIFNAVQHFGHYYFAAGVQELDGQAMAIVLPIPTNSGHLTKYLDEWDDKVATNHTWSKMRDHFYNAHKTLCKHTDATVSSLGGNNAAIKELLNAEKEAEQQREQQIANVATSQEQAHQQIKQLTSSMQNIERQMKRITRISGNGKRNQSSGIQQDVHPFDIQWNYCWIHGCIMENHKSNSCNTRSAGHKANDTFQDIKGSSTCNCFWLT